MKTITLEELKQMRGREGLVIPGCGGDLQEWIDGINELLTKAEVLKDGDTFKEIYSFQYDGIKHLLFDMEDVKLDIGKFAIWRIGTHEQFGGTWLSDYLDHKFGVEEENEPEMEL